MTAEKDPRLPPAVEVPDGPDWTGLLNALSAETAESLVVLVRTLCPHDALPPRVYRRVALAFDRLAGTSNQSAGLIQDTLARLDSAYPLPFRDCAESYRVAALTAIEGTPGFVFLQRSAVRYFYDDLEVWEAFGYEGASVHRGGYVDRGFDDLDWLPELPASLNAKGVAS